MPTSELATHSIAELAPLLRERRVSPQELVRSCLDRIERYDQELNSFITVLADSALAEAQAAERDIGAGNYQGPLHGIPVGLKDLIDTKGIRTTSGARIEADRVPDRDATVVERLRRAGAIILGKLNLHEYAYGPTSASSHFGPVRNPWNPEHLAGGSSGGSAAAVQASLVTAALGTDTGGSVRIPAALCGVVGLKPTYGRISRFGVTPLAWSLDHVGPLTKSVEDAAYLLGALAGHDPRDPASSTVPVTDFTRDLRAGVEGLRIGIPRRFFFDRVQPEVGAAVDAAIRQFAGLGASVREVELPGIDYAPAAQLAIAQTEATAYHRAILERRPADYSPDVRIRLETGLFVPAHRYSQALSARAYLIDRALQSMADLDILLCPTEAIVAPRFGETQVTFEDGTEGVRSALLRLTAPFNLYGFPALSVPCGFADGLPIGLQIAGKPFAEATVLRAGYAYEQAAAGTWGIRQVQKGR